MMRLTNHNGDTPLDLGLKETQSFRYLISPSSTAMMYNKVCPAKTSLFKIHVFVLPNEGLAVLYNPAFGMTTRKILKMSFCATQLKIYVCDQPNLNSSEYKQKYF